MKGPFPQGHNPGIKALHRKWGRRLRRFRLRAGLSEQKMADRAGTNRSAIRRIEKGDWSPSDEMRMALALVLNVRVDQLFPYPKLQSKGPHESEPDAG